MAAVPVVLVHGLWMPGTEMFRLRRRLAACGFAPVQFRYPSLRASVAANARRLGAFLARLEAPHLHLVGHSLGGLVIFRLLQEQLPVGLGRVVTLGTPAHGSYVARRLSHYRPSRWLVGYSQPEQAISSGVPWSGVCPLGTIAGTWPVGVGRLVPGLARPNDGTVALAETVVPGASDALTLPVSHFGMLYSRRVANQVCQFLHTGQFDH